MIFYTTLLNDAAKLCDVIKVSQSHSEYLSFLYIFSWESQASLAKRYTTLRKEAEWWERTFQVGYYEEN